MDIFKTILLPEYIVKIDYYDDNKSLVIVVYDLEGKIIEGIQISNDDPPTNPELN